MWLLDRFLRKEEKPRQEDMGSPSNSVPHPPYDLLDHEFLFPNGMKIRVVGFQFGGRFLRIPFVVRCRVLETHEIVLIDPLFVRRCATDVTPLVSIKEADRKPFVPRQEEVLRVIGWSFKTEFDHGVPVRCDLVRIADQDEGEGGGVQ